MNKKEFIRNYFCSIMIDKGVEVAYVSQLSPESCFFGRPRTSCLLTGCLLKKMYIDRGRGILTNLSPKAKHLQAELKQ